MPIYLYIKTHLKTGLKYLGKTKQNPYKYKGSGRDWIAHLKVHGNTVSTEIISECKTNEELTFWGRYYSSYYNIVHAMDDFGNKIWANRIPETGGGIGRSGFHKGQDNPMYGKSRDDLRGLNSPNKLSYRKKQSSNLFTGLWKDQEYRDKMSRLRAKLWMDPDYVEKMKSRPKTFKRVIINDIEYPSLKEAAKFLNINPATVSKRCASQEDKWINWRYIYSSW